jgi:16S rRNA (cytidine1402-2'-O)-methyltransferase
LLLEGKDHKDIVSEQQKNWKLMPLPEHMAYYEKQGSSQKEAMKQVAKDRGITKREVYAKLLSRTLPS